MSPRLPRPTGDELLRALRRVGWQEARITGSHHHPVRLTHPGVLITVTVHSGRSVPVGTLKEILDRAGLDAEDLRRRL